MEIPSVDFVFVDRKDCHDKAFGYDTVNSKELLGTGKHVLFALQVPSLLHAPNFNYPPSSHLIITLRKKVTRFGVFL